MPRIARKAHDWEKGFPLSHSGETRWRLASLKNLSLISGEFGTWTGLGPDDSPLLLRDASIQEIYALDWQAP